MLGGKLPSAPDLRFLVGSSGALPSDRGCSCNTSAPLPPSSQAFLTKVWWGKMCVDNGLLRVIACMLFFPLLFTSLITFRYSLQLGQALRQGFPHPVAGWENLPWCFLGQMNSSSTPATHRDKRLQPMGCLTRLRAFFTAPVVIFLMNILSYFTFLLLFAYVLMVDFQSSPSWREYLIYFWLFSLVCEEIRQVRGSRAEAGSRWDKVLLWVLLPGPAQLTFPRCISCHHPFGEVPAKGLLGPLVPEPRGSPWL